MFTKRIYSFVDILIEKKIVEKDNKEIIIYGFKAGLELILNIITTLILGLIFGLVFETFLFFFSFSLIRTYAGGYHCKKAINCYFFSSGLIALVLFIIKFIASEYILIASTVMLVCSVPILLKYAPIETPTKPLDEIEKKYFRKKTIRHLIIELTLVATLFSSGFDKIAYVICLGIFVSAVLVFLQLQQKQ